MNLEVLERKLMLVELENKNLKLKLRTAKRNNLLPSICLVAIALGLLYHQVFNT
ncbi:MAG: hypothetical protein KDC93_01250 [Cyclobacteriaceae bacterium]|nr:hypothetical protein [Cyclobacteriaceae bacterium]